MSKIPEDVKKKIEEKYPPTFEVLGIRHDDAVFIAKRKAAEFGYSLSTPEQSAVQPEAVFYILPDGRLCSEEYYSFLTDEQKAQCKIYNGAVQDGKEDEGK